MTDRELLKQVLETLECWPGGRDMNELALQVMRVTAALRERLAQPVPHGCHIDLEPNMMPDGCVLDDGTPYNCIYAQSLLREGKDKTSCEYWKPIEVKR